MKQIIPSANALIATLYLFFIIAIAYLAKLLFRKEAQPSTHKKIKYSSANILKGLSNPSIDENINPIKIVLKSFALKYSIVGTFVNQQKFYLFKQVFVIAVICVACRVINRITLWPIALTIVFSCLFFVALQVFMLPFVFEISQKIQQQNKDTKKLIENIEIQLSFPIVGLNQQGKSQIKQQSKFKPTHSHKFMLFVAVMLFIILLLISQTMFTIYNSVSNLGALNIESLILTVLIDQLAVRPFFAITIIFAIKFIHHKYQTSIATSSSENTHKTKHTKTATLFNITLFRNLCENVLISEMNNIYITLGQPHDTVSQTSASKKKNNTPLKLSKIIPVFVQSQTMIQMEKADMIHEQDRKKMQQKVDEFRSPIKSLQLSIMKHETVLFTSMEKRMFGGQLQLENNQHQINKNNSSYGINKMKINPNQFFSSQRLPKQELTHCQQKFQDDDGLVLVEGGFNLIKNKYNTKKQPNSIQFQAYKKKKQHGRYNNNNNKRRQLIITGSSPYLEYLPDMMKKEKLLRKSNNTPSQPQLPPIPKKIL